MASLQADNINQPSMSKPSRILMHRRTDGKANACFKLDLIPNLLTVHAVTGTDQHLQRAYHWWTTLVCPPLPALPPSKIYQAAKRLGTYRNKLSCQLCWASTQGAEAATLNQDLARFCQTTRLTNDAAHSSDVWMPRISRPLRKSKPL